MNSEIQLRYRWRKTWPDKENDFVGLDGDKRFGRIYAHHTGEWMWSMYGASEGRMGTSPSAREAARDVEDLWDRAKEGKLPPAPSYVPPDSSKQTKQPKAQNEK